MDDFTSIEAVLENMPGAFGEGLRAAAQRQAEFIAKHGAEAWEKRISEKKMRDMAELDRQHEIARSRLRIEKSGLADSLDAMTFDTFEAKEPWQKVMLDKCRRFIAQNKYRWLYISGQPGCGKTHLGTAVCGHYLKAGKPTRYMTFLQLMNALKANVNDESGYQSVLREYGYPAVLYIDDFMKFWPRPTDPDVKHTFELLNMRLVRGGITIITSERSLLEICDIDEALGSRIKQRCGEFAIDIARKAGRNYRMRDIERV